jgi:hypothetical protein
MNVIELKTSDPKRFEQEYHEWCQYTPHYDWWEYLYEQFKADCAALGVQVNDIQFSGFHSQGDGAAFEGRVFTYEWMERKGFDVTHPAAYLACKEDGSYVGIHMRNRGNGIYTNFHGPLQSEPSGIFIGLDDEAWNELVDEQLCDLNVEDEILGFCEALVDKLYRDLQEEYEILTSEESFIDSCQLNEVTFEENENAIRA